MFDPHTLKDIRLIKQTDRQKISLVEDCNGQKYLKREINEDRRELYKALQNVRNPHVPVIYSVERTDCTIVIEEYIDAVPLSVIMSQSEKIDKKKILAVTNRLLDALDALHAQGIIHRDIKPDNIMINAQGHVWLIDYDIARIYRNEIRRDTESMGTFGYAPIEQYGMMPTDFKSDIYSFGVCIRALLEYANIKCFLNSIADKCTRLDPALRYKNVKKLKNAIRWHYIRTCLLAFGVLMAVSLIALSFFGSDDTAPDNTKKTASSYSATNKETPKSQSDDKNNGDKNTNDKNETANTDNKPRLPAQTDDGNTDEEISFDGEFWGFASGTTEKTYSQYSNYPSVSVFSTDTPYTHLLFLDDMKKSGKIKFGKNDAVVDAEFTLNNGTLSLSLNDSKGNTIIKKLSYNGQHKYDRMYTSNLRKNADIICYDFDGDGYKELLLGLNEGIVGAEGGVVYCNVNYSVAWCIKYDESAGFTLCKGDMFSKGASFSINRHTQMLNLRWEQLGDAMGYCLSGDKIQTIY